MPGSVKNVLAFSSIFIVAMLLISGCNHSEPKRQATPEILIYCGITMIKPVHELAHIFEARRNCEVKIVKGGSGDLLKAIKLNQKGDLFLPGESSYMDSCMADGLCKRNVCVGFNRSTMVVRKNNPNNIPGELKSMANPQYKVVIANPETGSIGLEAKSVLERAGLFKQVLANNPIFTTDSKDITNAVSEGVADVGLNWYATTQWPENSTKIDSLDIPEDYAPRTPLLLGILNSSPNTDLASDFMNLAISHLGRDIFKKFGFEPGD